MTESVQTTTESAVPSDVSKDELLDRLHHLESVVTTPHQRAELEETRQLVARMPGSAFVEEQISKYTSRDIGEAFVGSIIFGLPLLVEDGVFEIAEFLLSITVLSVPVFLLANVLFVATLTAKLLYVVDFRDVVVSHPLFGLVPRRLVGVLGVSFLTATGLMIMWGRVFDGDPTSLEMFARVTVIWTAAALGAALGDILPGESKGTDLTLENIEGMVSHDDTD